MALSGDKKCVCVFFGLAVSARTGVSFFRPILKSVCKTSALFILAKRPLRYMVSFFLTTLKINYAIA